jgi:hypothetical protein
MKLNLHVVGAMCESLAEDEPRIGKFSNGSSAPQPGLIRMAAKPENFTNAGFFFGTCRTPRDSSGPQVGPLGAEPRHGKAQVIAPGATPSIRGTGRMVKSGDRLIAASPSCIAGVNPLSARHGVGGGLQVNSQ